MNKRQLRIDQGRVIPLFPRLLITSLLIALFIYLMDQSSKPDFAFMLGIIVGSVIIHGLWSSRKVFAIDQTAATLSHYYWLIGIKAQNRQEHGKGKAVILRRIGRDQKSPGNYPWKILLKLESGEEVFVISRDNSEDGWKVATKIAEQLGLEAKKE